MSSFLPRDTWSMEVLETTVINLSPTFLLFCPLFLSYLVPERYWFVKDSFDCFLGFIYLFIFLLSNFR